MQLNITYKKLLKLVWCSRLALRNTQALLKRLTLLLTFRKLESTSLIRALLSGLIAKRRQLLIAKKRKNDPTHCCSRVTSKEIQSKAPKKFIVTISYIIQVKVKVRTKMKESGSNENNFSELALQQNTLELTLKRIKPEEI